MFSHLLIKVIQCDAKSQITLVAVIYLNNFNEMIFVCGSLSVECVLDSGSDFWGGRDSLFASVQSLLSESRFSSGRALMACSVLVLREASAAAATPTAPTTTPVMRCGLTAPPLRL